MRIVNTDNFGGDYPDEWFLPVHFGSKERAEYVLQQGFEP